MEYLLHLSKDKKLKRLIETQEPLVVSRRKDAPFYLIASIMSHSFPLKWPIP